jgi:hypothetical protein
MSAAARDLALAARPAALTLLKSLAERPRVRHELDEEVPGALQELDPLVFGGLVQAGQYNVIALTPRGREVWMSVRSLVQ